jgi:hypothetical protein
MWPSSSSRRSLPDTLALLLQGLALLAAGLMLGYRFANFELVPFILDEPQFLEAAQAQVRTGQWLSASPLVGTQGVTYGPSVLWFYGLVHWLLGPDPRTSILVMCATLTLAHAALALAVARLFRGGPLLAAALLALVASSPYQFFWSRLAWDQLVNVCAAWTVVLLSLPGPLGWGRRLALGGVLGVAISSHLMVMPLVALTLTVLAWEQRHRPRQLVATLGPVLAVLLGVNLPYLGFLRAHPPPPLPPASRGFSWELLGEQLLQPARVATAWRLDYFFDGAWPEFLRGSGVVGRALEHSVAGLALLVLASTCGLLLIALRARPPEQRRVAGLALGTWLGYAGFYTLRVLERHPHYQFPTWWVVVVGVAGALCWLRERSPRLGTTATGAVFVGAALQLLVSVEWMGYIRAHGGSRGVHYSVPLAAQQRILQEACARAPGELLLRNLTNLFPQSLAYVAQTTPACEGKVVHICQQDCPPPLLQLRYAGSVGGALVLE